jgi:transcriptional regulator with AAA-type ATPase domain
MHEKMIEMLAALRERTNFEDAASVLMAAMLRTAEAALENSPLGSGGRVLRAMVHHRPADGYRRLTVLDAEGGGGTHLDEAFLPSATAWRWIVENRRPASIDVNLALIQTEAPGGPQPTTDPALLGEGATTQESRARLLRRGATHVHVLPLLGTRGAVDGLVSIEAHFPSAIGQRAVWSTCSTDLQLITALAAPFVAELPLRPSIIAATDPLLPVIGKSMAGLVAILRVFREQRETLLIGGPTGSGKSRLARWCHETSRRTDGPFEVLDLTAVPSELQMGELFGWRKGAFTGALRDNPGALGRAQGGTLFIDEIDKLSLRAQAGLLHVLEERTYRPLGDSGSEQKADVRFIAGTNANLSEAVQQKRLREDLYYRINVLPVQLPPLADRQDEIAAWAGFMLRRRHSESMPTGHVEIEADALATLLNEPWPGNLRQLDNIVRRAYALAVTEVGGIPQQTILITDEHVTRALAYDARRSETSTALPSLLRAAAEFLAEAKRRRSRGFELDLDLADSFKGLVLSAALEEEEDRDEIFRLFGKESLMKSRNHHKVLRREIERGEALVRALSSDTPLAPLRLLTDTTADTSRDDDDD